MTNLYDFLRAIRTQGKRATPGAAPLGNADKLFITISQEELAWLDQYFQSPDAELHFKAKATGEMKGDEPVMALDFAIAGDGFEIFSLICEAMVQNYQFAEAVLKAASFYRDHIPTCPTCSKKHFGNQKPVLDWRFLPHQN